ncbi:hypothetical protein ABZ920_29755 [Streptomyces sp. NPDC046831]|uniref:SCO2400 family protein n=1 Tax=Streptomyces sp. NPDC046831 TaxID=3154805 RepID=UPI0033D608AB
MDYCSSCRRHLNGALVCPGCGAYAPDIAPVNPGGRTVPAPRVTMAVPSAAGARNVPLPDAWRETVRPGDDEAAAVRDDSADDAPDGPADTGPVRAGRAARRRRRVQWKKTQRRALVATAVALVGGGLTVASMDRHTGGRAQAATGPEIAGAVGEDPADGTVPSSSHLTGRRSAAAPGPQSPAAGHRHHPSAPASRLATPDARPDTALPPAPRAPIAPSVPQQPGTTVPPSAGAHPADAGAGSNRPAGTTQQTPPPAPPATGGTNPETPPSTGSPSDPTTSPTSPSQLCLLVLCIS